VGQKTHPFGFRVGITEAHKSRWYAPKALFAELLVEDFRIRNYVDRRLNRTPPFAAVSDIHIERTREELTIILKTARPGLVIGPKGQEIDQLTQDLQTLTGRKVSTKIIEIQNPDFRRLAKQRCEASMHAGAKGVRIQLSGRLGGAEMSRRFQTRLGSIPLSTLQAHVDYACVTAKTSYGTIGVKVWVFKGMYTDSEEEQLDSKAAGARARARGRH
jgi:small subunit ribosomal protein S3